MFAPAIAVDEDVANANSTGCLAAHLLDTTGAQTVAIEDGADAASGAGGGAARISPGFRRRRNDASASKLFSRTTSRFWRDALGGLLISPKQSPSPRSIYASPFCIRVPASTPLASAFVTRQGLSMVSPRSRCHRITLDAAFVTKRHARAGGLRTRVDVDTMRRDWADYDGMSGLMRGQTTSTACA
jgi:hypothetical protein